MLGKAAWVMKLRFLFFIFQFSFSFVLRVEGHEHTRRSGSSFNAGKRRSALFDLGFVGFVTGDSIACGRVKIKCGNLPLNSSSWLTPVHDTKFNSNLIQINILRNPILIHRIHLSLNQRCQIIHHLFRYIISRIINIICRHTLDCIRNITYRECFKFRSIRLVSFPKKSLE